MEPHPGQVAEAVSQILESVWPARLDEGLLWLEGLGIETATGEELPREEPSSRSWHMAVMPGWGTAKAGWSTYQDRFADVFWFLWEGESSEDVLNAAVELAGQLASAFGEPKEAMEVSSGSGGTWWWQMEAYSIEMYAYAGNPTRDGHRTGPPCVQFSVALREVSDPRETEARRAQEVPPGE